MESEVKGGLTFIIFPYVMFAFYLCAHVMFL